MTDVEETILPGVGIRYDFVTTEGKRLGVVHRRTGRRELLIFEPDDQDTCREIVRLSDEDSHALVELLGGGRVAEHVGSLQQMVQGLAIDWLPISEGTPYVGRSIGDTRARTRTGVSIVAVLRGDDAFPAPGPDFGLREGDTLVVVGTTRGIEGLAVLLRTG